MVYIPTNLSLKGTGATITRDLECPGCEYNLKGLRYGGHCPECGAAIGLRPGDDSQPTSDVSHSGFWGRVLAMIEPHHTPGITAGLTEAPLGYLHRLSLACRLMQAALILIPVLPLAGLLVIKLGADADKVWPLAGIASLMPAALWAFGVWVMVSPRRTRELRGELAHREWLGTRRAARFTQCCWLPASAVLAIISLAAFKGTALPGPPIAWTIAMGAFAAIGFLGLSPVGLYASNIADWANDTGLCDRLRLASLAVFFAPPVIVLSIYCAMVFDNPAGRFFAGIMGLLACLLPIAWLIQLVVATMQFISMATWAQINADTRLERDQRLAEKAARDRARAEHEYKPDGPAEVAGPIPLAGDLPLVGEASPKKPANASATHPLTRLPPAPKRPERVVRHTPPQPPL